MPSKANGVDNGKLAAKVAQLSAKRRSDNLRRENASYSVEGDALDRLNNRLDGSGLNRSAFMEEQVRDALDLENIDYALVPRSELIRACEVALQVCQSSIVVFDRISAYADQLGDLALSTGAIMESYARRVEDPKAVAAMRAYHLTMRQTQFQQLRGIMMSLEQMLLCFKQNYESLKGGLLEEAVPLERLLTQVDIMLTHFEKYAERIQSRQSPEPVSEGRNWQEFSNWYNRSMYHLPD